MHLISRCEPFDLTLLRETLRLLARRHTALRTYYLDDGIVDGAHVLPAADAHWPIRVSDADSPDFDQAEAFQWLQRDFEPFEQPLLRASLWRSGRGDVLGLAVDHSLFDASSAAALFQDLAFVYECLRSGGPAGGLEVLASDVGRFATKERRWLRGNPGAVALAYWDKQYSGLGAYPRVGLPIDLSAVGEPVPSVYETTVLEPEQASGNVELRSRLRTTEFMTAAAALAVAVREHADSDRVAMLFQFARRTRLESSAVVGYLANRSLIRLAVRRGDTMAVVAPRVRAALSGGLPHGLLSHDHYLRLRHPQLWDRRPTMPHLQLNVVRQEPVPDIDGVPCERVAGPERPEIGNYPGLRVNVGHHADGSISVMGEYPGGMFDADLIRSLLRSLAGALVGIEL